MCDYYMQCMLCCSSGMEISTVVCGVSTCMVKKTDRSLELVIDEEDQLTIKMSIQLIHNKYCICISTICL